MGAKASSAAQNGDHHQNSRTRTFSTSSSTDVAAPTGFNLLRALPNIHVSQQNDRQRARSLSSVPDLQASSESSTSNINNNNNSNHHNNHHHNIVGGGGGGVGGIPDGIPIGQQLYGDENTIRVGTEAGFDGHVLEHDENQTNSATARVYTATSLPSHIWSLNGIKCPVCSKFVLPDDIECHLVMCLTKPRLSYNEDVLTDVKGECVICLEDLNPGDVIARLPCLCIYHKGCIDRWFEVNRCCPEHPGD